VKLTAVSTEISSG